MTGVELFNNSAKNPENPNKKFISLMEQRAPIEYRHALYF